MTTSKQPEPGSHTIVLTEIEQFGGAERSVLALARWLDARGLPVHLVTYDDRADLARYVSHRLPVVELKVTGMRNRIQALGAYFKARKDGPAPLMSGYQSALHATLAGLKGFHNLMHDTPSLFMDPNDQSLKTRVRIAISNRIAGKGLRSGGVTIVTSEYLLAECRKDFGVDAQIARMGGMEDAAGFRVRAVKPGGPLRMLSVCRIEGNKRIDWMLDALAEMERGSEPLSARVDWRLDLAGKGPLLDKLRGRSQALGLGERVTFHGFVTDGELEAMYGEAHLFLMPAVQGYGIPAVESLHRGIPVLLHRESGVSDILLDTPWATVLHGQREEMGPKLTGAIEGVLAGRHAAVSLPAIPTEDEWAERVARLCGWVR